MRWLKAFFTLLLNLFAIVVAIRMFANLPSLDGRTISRAFSDTEGTRIGSKSSDGS